MLKVFICEDNKKQLEDFNNYVENIIFSQDLDMDISLVTNNPYDILNFLKDNSVNGLYLLDVDLKTSINGIELAEQIRKYDPRGFIVFITTHSEMSYLTFKYKVEAMDYIIKDNYKEVKSRIKECILNAHAKYSSNVNTLHKVFTFEVENRTINIEYNSILFFETSSSSHKVVLHAKNRQVEFYSTMKNIENNLDERFCRCHESFIINKDNIKEINKSKRTIFMNNGQECIASIRGLRKLNKK